MVSSRVMVVRMVMMRLVMVVMGRVATPAGATVRRIASAGAHGRRPVVVVMQVYQARRRFRDGRTPYRSRRVVAATCVIEPNLLTRRVIAEMLCERSQFTVEELQISK